MYPCKIACMVINGHKCDWSDMLDLPSWYKFSGGTHPKSGKPYTKPFATSHSNIPSVIPNNFQIYIGDRDDRFNCASSYLLSVQDIQTPGYRLVYTYCSYVYVPTMYSGYTVENIRNTLNVPYLQITFIFIGQTRLVFGNCVCTSVYIHKPNAFGFWQPRLHLCTKHSNAFRTFLNCLKNSKRVWHEPKLHILRLPLFANFDLWSVSVGWV